MLLPDFAVLDPEHDGNDPVWVEESPDDRGRVALDEIQELRRQQHQLQPTAVDVILDLGRQNVVDQVLDGKVHYPSDKIQIWRKIFKGDCMTK